VEALDSVIEKYGDDLNELVDRFTSSGLGDKVSWWVGTGENETITPDELQQGLGQDEIDRIARATGRSADEVAGELALALPGAIDDATPMG
jgi:uncharacterized protein YidB (DUF937 family)